jgi:O-antigen/teichoic acid export membrane protein
LKLRTLITELYTSLKKEKVKKALVLYVTMLVGVVAGIVLSMLNTRMLGKELYGDFKFVQNLFTFAETFLTLGVFYSGGRIIAMQKDAEKRRELYGTIIIFAALISLVLIVAGFVFSLFETRIFGNDLKWVIIACLPLVFVFPFQLCLEQMLQGDYRIYTLSFHRLAPKVLNILILLAFYAFFRYKLLLNLEIFLISMAVPIIAILFWLKPKFAHFRHNSRLLWKENKTYGNPAYIGAITGLASAQIAGFTLSYYLDNVSVGFFALAITATTPLAMLPVAFGTTLFRDFVTLPSIPPKVSVYTALLGLSTLILFILAIKYLILWLYPPDFYPVIKLCYITAIGSTFHGFGDFISRFVGAKGKGKLIRNCNFILCAINVSGYYGLVLLWGTGGAAITKLLAGFVYMLYMVVVYATYIKIKKY